MPRVEQAGFRADMAVFEEEMGARDCMLCMELCGGVSIPYGAAKFLDTDFTD